MLRALGFGVWGGRKVLGLQDLIFAASVLV